MNFSLAFSRRAFQDCALFLLLCLGLLAGPRASAGEGRATLVIDSPKENDVFEAPAQIQVSATATDLDGDIRRVQFYANDILIGVSEHLTKDAVIPGRPRIHSIEWKDVPAGEYRLTARAVATGGDVVTAEPISIVVAEGPFPDRPFVRIEAVRPETSEIRPEAFVLPGVFVVSRTGPLEKALSVLVVYGGSATRGRDYKSLPESVTFEPGQKEVELLVVANMDDLVEGAETVVARLTYSPAANPLGDPYIIDPEHESATVLIHDANTSGDLPLISIAALRPSTSEPSPITRVAPGELAITRSGPTATGFNVYLQYEGSAEAGVDYDKLPDFVTFEPGQTVVRLYVAAFDDNLAEPDETVVAQLIESPLDHIPQYAVDPERAIARVVIHDSDDPVPGAVIEITSPRDGESFPPGAIVRIEAVAIDPDGYLPRVEFLNGETIIGVSEIAFIVAPDPGTPIKHVFEWQGLESGAAKLSARAVKADGSVVQSRPVRISFGETSSAILEITEPLDGSRFRAGADVTIRATAIDPDGYIPTVEFYANERLLGVSRIDFFTAPDPGTPIHHEFVWKTVPPGEYLLTARALDSHGNPVSSAPIQIRVEGVSEPPVTLVQPRDGEVFVSGQVVHIIAEAGESDDPIERLEVLVNREVLGRTSDRHIEVEWVPAEPGVYVLHARVVTKLGQEHLSESAKVLVRGIDESTFVHRELTGACIPGESLAVRLLAKPFEGARAYAVEDEPPGGWVLSDISHDGVFDHETGRVKFGPFLDGVERIFTYRLTPPADAGGESRFTGLASINGQGYRIGGDQSIRSASTFHPADADQNWSISQTELTGYAASWKAGGDALAETTPIPISFVTRAGHIWRNGERYIYVADAGEPPLCWVTVTEDEHEPPAVDPAAIAARSISAPATPGAAAEVVLAVVPPVGTSSYAVEERVHPNWEFVSASEQGSYDPVTRTIRWGLFADGATRTLAYSVRTPKEVLTAARLHGVLSCDGSLYPVGGAERVLPAASSSQLRFSEVKKLPSGRAGLKITAPPGQVCVLESSEDLKHWTEVRTVYIGDGELALEDESMPLTPHAYYRLRTPQ